MAARSNLMLALTGSAIGTVEQMLGGRGALRRRPTLELLLEPIALTSASEFLPGLSPDVLIEAYAACGYPLHMLAWDPAHSTEDNLEELAGTPGGILLTDARSILSEELSDTGVTSEFSPR